jgi:hypothetical protein
MNYTRYFFSILFSFLLCLVVYLSAIFYQIGVPVSDDASLINKVYTFKSNLISSFNHPKLLIVSGSNANAGISCQMIQESLDIPCLNGGTHAGLGVDYLLNRAYSWAHSGDIVLLPLEYNNYLDQGIPSDLLIDYVFSYDPKYLKSVDLMTKARFISGLSFERIGLGILAKLKSAKSIDEKPVSAQEIFKNEYGDNTHQKESEITEELQQTIANLNPLKIEGQISANYGLKSITKFVNWCLENKITVLATWPNTVWFDTYNGAKPKEFFKSIEDFYKSLHVSIIGTPQSAMYSKSMFYDTIYHLHDRGKRLRTKQLITQLQNYIPKSTDLSLKPNAQ